MAPPFRQRRKVLSEEEYTATLSSILQRDYFPEIPQLERQAAILERRAQGDIAGAVAVRRAARRLKQHEETIASLEEEAERDLNDERIRRIARPLHQESITGFHARATNEDDEEFHSNQKKEVKANRERLDALFRPKNDGNPKLLLAMASDQFQAESNRIAASDWKNPAVRNGLFFNPTPFRNENEAIGSTDSRRLLAQGSETKDSSQLALMPPPADVKSKDTDTGIEASLPKQALVEYVPKSSLEKRIEPSQTRFPNQIVPLPIRKSLAGASDNELETDGSATDASTDLDAPLNPIEQERRRHQIRMEKVQRSYVAMTPLVVPGAGNESPITTWGTVDSTPLVLSGQEVDDHSKALSSFSMARENERDRAAQRAEKELARRAKRAKKSSTKSTKFKKSASLTPAALSLLEKTKRTPSRSRDAFASALRVSYTPKLGAKSGLSLRKRGGDTAFNSTPLASRKEKANGK